ncbi:hypothetical protein ACFLQ2_05640 [archaeon]
MEKGLSAVVGVVLIIGTAVVGAAAMYFFAGGIATTQPSTDSPTPITIVPLGNGDILVANLGSDTFTGELYASDPAITIACPLISASEQGVCNVTGVTDALDFTIYGAGAGSIVVQTAAIMETGGCPWEGGCTYIWDNGAGDGVWEDGRNWGQTERRDYPQGAASKAIFNATSTDDVTTSSDLTVGEIELESGYTGTLTLGGDLAIDASGVHDGELLMSNGELDANGYDMTIDAMTSIGSAATLTAGSGNHQFGEASYTGNWGINLGGTFDGGSGNHSISTMNTLFPTLNFTSGVTDFTGFRVGYTLRYWGGTVSHGGGTMKFSSSGTQRLYCVYRSLKTLNNVIVDKGSGLLGYNANYGFPLLVEGDLTIESGTFESKDRYSYGTSRNLTVDGATTISGTLRTYAATVSLGSGRKSGYALTVTNGIFDGGSGDHTIGSISCTGASANCTLSNGTTTINGAPSQDGRRIDVDPSIGDWLHGGGAVVFPTVTGLNTIIDMGGASHPLNNVTMSSTTQISVYPTIATIDGAFLQTAGTWFGDRGCTLNGLVTVTGGTFRPRSNAWTFNGGILINGGTFDVPSTGTVDSNGAFSMTSGAFSHTSSTNASYNGTFTISGGTVTHTAGFVKFDADSSLTSGGESFKNIEVSAGTTVTLDNATVDYTYIASGATLNISAGTTYHCTTLTGPGTLNVLGTKTC